jgi:predicted HAD superfamily Cof-like phosphohydrolase
MTTHIDQVRQFTEQSKGMVCPKAPIALDDNAVKFIVRMVLSELAELYQTIMPAASRRDAIAYLTRVVIFQKCKSDESDRDAEDQADVFKLIFDVLKTAAIEHNMPFNAVFDAVHAANMNKRWADGTFHRRPEDGKVIKPDGWQEADLKVVLASYWSENKPTPINADTVRAIIFKIIVRLGYLIDIVAELNGTADQVILECANSIDYTHRPNAIPLSREDAVEAQIDALIDVYYYILDTMAKHGMQ